MRKFFSGLVAALSLLTGVPVAAQQPLQWKYDFQNGTATATYPGNVVVQGNLNATTINVNLEGIKCDNTDETAAWNALFAKYPNGVTVIINSGGVCKFSSLNVPPYTTIDGGSRDRTTLTTNSATADALTLGHGVTIRNVTLNASVPRTAGYFIKTAKNGTLVENIGCVGYFICYGVAGVGPGPSQISIFNVLRNVTTFNPAVGTGSGFATYDNFSNAVFDGGAITGPTSGQQPDFGFKILGGDTMIISDVNVTLHGIGLDVKPLPSFNIYALNISNSLFDSAGTISGGVQAPSCEIAPGTGGGVWETVFSNVWCGLSVTDGFRTGGAGTIGNFFSTNLQTDGNGGSGIHITTASLQNFSFVGGGSGGNTQAGIYIQANAQYGSFLGVMARTNLRGNNGTYGLVASSGSDITFDANAFSGVSGAVNLAGTTRFTVKNNIGYNPRGPKTVAPTASPWTYTAGPEGETINMGNSGGNMTVVSGGITFCNAVTTCILALNPNQQFTNTYTGTTTAASNVQ